MARFVDKLYPGKKGTLLHSAVHEVADVALTGGAVAGFGYLANHYRERAHVAGVPVDAAAGVGLTALALVCARFKSPLLAKAIPAARVIGHAGLYSWLHTFGAGMGAQKSGVKRIMVGPGVSKDQVKANLPKSTTVLGEIPRAPHGDFLSASQLAALAKG